MRANSLLPPVTADILCKIAPRVSGAKAQRQAEIIRDLGDLLGRPEYQGNCGAAYVNTPLRMAHFLAQLAHESDGFCTTEEYASGAAYEGRRDLGNTKTGDGRRFKGRGLIQVTGRKNYRAFYQYTNEVWKADNPLQEPAAVARFPLALLSAFWYWQSRDLNGFADTDDLAAITNIINCGREACKANGGHSRAQYLACAKAVLGVSGEAPRWDTVEGLNAALGA